MDLKTFELFARYNVWSTQKLNQVLKISLMKISMLNADFSSKVFLEH